MSYADTQEALGLWKPKKVINPKYQQRKHLCPVCARNHFKVKMDYLFNKHERMRITVYDVSYFKCPRCGFMGKEFMRIEGKGFTRKSLYKEYGGK